MIEQITLMAVIGFALGFYSKRAVVEKKILESIEVKNQYIEDFNKVHNGINLDLSLERTKHSIARNKLKINELNTSIEALEQEKQTIILWNSDKGRKKKISGNRAKKLDKDTEELSEADDIQKDTEV